jgi:hypothetical protein
MKVVIQITIVCVLQNKILDKVSIWQMKKKPYLDVKANRK